MTCYGCDKAKEAAVKTLEGNGYTYHGGELWQPPLGDPPDFDLIDEIDKYLRGRYGSLPLMTDTDKKTFLLLEKARKGLMSRSKNPNKWILKGNNDSA